MSPLSIVRFASLLLAVSLSWSALAAEARPRIGLVLGGGGARGAAHIGVLEVLRELRVPVDCVAGTSMGALVAGVWAAGMAPEAMRANLAAADWQDIFIDNPDYSEMSYRNKAISRQYLPGSESGVGFDGVRLQGGVVNGQKIKLFFNQLVRANQGERNIEQLPLPLSLVATDIGTGEAVVFRDGALTTAMRASMSVPGLLAPVEHQGRKLVDGGLVDNLPVAEVRTRCQADVVIAVNVGSPLLKAEEVGSLLSVSTQMIAILTEQNVQRSLATLRPGDVLITPELTGVGPGDFDQHNEAAARGRLAAEAARAQLAAWSLPEADYARWWASIASSRGVSPKIDAVEIVGLQRVNPAVIERHLQASVGETIRPTQINRDLLRMYGDGYYESVDYTVLSQAQRTTLRVMPQEKRWGPDYLRFGVNLQADTSQGSIFGLRMAYHQTWLNALGGELVYTGEFGTASRLGVHYYQPLDVAQRWFAESRLGVERQRVGVFENDARTALYYRNESSLTVGLGRNVGVLGPLRLGWQQRRWTYHPEIGNPGLPQSGVTYGGWRASIDFDQFDRMHFPTRGWAASLAYFDSPGQGYARTDVDLRSAFSWGKTVFGARLGYAGALRGQLPVFDAAVLGGFKNMTALSSQQLQGDDLRYVGLSAEQIIGTLPLGLRGDMRLGFIVEGARAGRRFTETTRTGWIDSTAFYIGGETPLGPTYVGFGFSATGISNLFLFIGTP